MLLHPDVNFAFGQSFAEKGPWDSIDTTRYFRLTAASKIWPMDLVAPADKKSKSKHLCSGNVLGIVETSFTITEGSTNLNIERPQITSLWVLFDLSFHSSCLETWEQILSFSESSLEYTNLQIMNWCL